MYELRASDWQPELCFHRLHSVLRCLLLVMHSFSRMHLSLQIFEADRTEASMLEKAGEPHFKCVSVSVK